MHTYIHTYIHITLQQYMMILWAMRYCTVF